MLRRAHLMDERSGQAIFLGLGCQRGKKVGKGSVINLNLVTWLDLRMSTGKFGHSCYSNRGRHSLSPEWVVICDISYISLH